MNQVDKKYLILGSLCALVLMLVVGYAAFSTILNIKGTSNISSNWDVKITNIAEGEKTGSASTLLYTEGDKAGKKIMEYENTTATFATGLQSPGDSIEYIITVSNEGTLDAKLDKIMITDSNNEYITFETSGLIEGEELAQKTSKTLKVKVTFKDVEIDKMDSSSATLKVTLDFSQPDGTSSDTPVEPEFTYTGYLSTMGSYKIGDNIEEDYYSGYLNSIDNIYAGGGSTVKHYVENFVIKKSYICFTTDQVYCLEGGNPNVYAANKTILENQQSYFTNNGGSCSGDNSKYECSISGWSSVSRYADSTGLVYTKSGMSSCSISADGDSSCRM